MEKKLRIQILEACHDSRVGGCHFGRDKTLDKIVKRYYWKGVCTDVEKWVNVLNAGSAIFIKEC